MGKFLYVVKFEPVQFYRFFFLDWQYWSMTLRSDSQTVTNELQQIHPTKCQRNLCVVKTENSKRTEKMFTLWSLIEASMLVLNAVCILHEERFLAKGKSHNLSFHFRNHSLSHLMPSSISQSDGVQIVLHRISVNQQQKLSY